MIIKSLIILAILPFLFSCGSDENKEEEYYYLQIVTQYDSGDEAPEGYVHVFYLDNTYPEESKANFLGGETCVMTDVNGEYILPVYSKKLTKDKDLSTGLYENTSTIAIYPSDLLYLYGEPDPKGKFLIAIAVFRPTDTSESGYSYTCTETNFVEKKLKKIFKLHPKKEEMNIYGEYNETW